MKVVSTASSIFSVQWSRFVGQKCYIANKCLRGTPVPIENSVWSTSKPVLSRFSDILRKFVYLVEDKIPFKMVKKIFRYLNQNRSYDYFNCGKCGLSKTGKTSSKFTVLSP